MASSCLVKSLHFLSDWLVDYGFGLFIRGCCGCKIISCIGIHEVSYNCSIFLAVAFNSISVMLVGISQLIGNRDNIRALLITSVILSAFVDIFIVLSVIFNAALDRHRESRFGKEGVSDVRRSIGLTSNPKKHGRLVTRANHQTGQTIGNDIDDDDEESALVSENNGMEKEATYSSDDEDVSSDSDD